jgi:hypothetical protein
LSHKLPKYPIIYLDKSLSQIYSLRLSHGINIHQFKTPLTGYKSGTLPFILDNGAYSGYPVDKFSNYFKKYIDDPMCQFIVIPDVPFNHFSTLSLFDSLIRSYRIPVSKTAFVAQNGSSITNIPWEHFQCLFIGGDDYFKDNKALIIARHALSLNKWVHVGRLNSPNRLTLWFNYCHSFDGSGISRFDEMLFSLIDSYVNLIKYPPSSLEAFF